MLGRACIDRRTGAPRVEVDYAPVLMRWLYDSPVGWAVTRALMVRPWVSRLYGWLNRLPYSRRRIRSFVRRMGIDLAECTEPVGHYASFSAFIERRIDLARRPIDPDPRTCIAPVDARVLAFATVGRERTFRIKQTRFDLGRLVQDPDLAARFDRGAAVILRLHLSDYHHFHFPVDGVPRAPVTFGQRLYAMSVYSDRRLVPFLTENIRARTLIDSDRFGVVCMLEIGSFTIGSVHQEFAAGSRAQRGEHKGFFALGGSCVVLLFEPDAIVLDDDLVTNTARGVETYVRLGERLGIAPEHRAVHASLSS